MVLTAGVGEHDAELRAEVLAPLAHFGVRIDPGRNVSVCTPHARHHQSGRGRDSRPRRTQGEEPEIARQVLLVVAAQTV